MCQSIFKLVSIVLFAGVLMASCAKDEVTSEDPSLGSGGSAANSSFTWVVNNGSTISANDYFYVNAFNNIVGKKTSNTSFVDISLDNLLMGAYTISASKGILLEYNDGSKSYNASSGVVNITTKSGGLLSGNFTAAISSSSITSISGQFTDIPEK